MASGRALAAQRIDPVRLSNGSSTTNGQTVALDRIATPDRITITA